MLQLLIMRILWNKLYLCLVYLSNLAYLLRPVYDRSTILGVFGPLSPSLYDIPPGALNCCRAKQTFFKFDFFQTPSESGRSITSDTDATSLEVISCTCGDKCDNMSMLLFFYGATLSLWLGVSQRSSSISLVNQVSLRLIFSVEPLFDLCCTISVQFEGISPSLMNGTVGNSSSNTTLNWGDTWTVSGFRTIANDTP